MDGARGMFEARSTEADALSERIPEGARAYPASPALPGRPLRIGLLNNMPDAALAQTERQFRHLVGSGAELLLFSLDGLPRGAQARAHLEAAYASHRALPSARLDALIVTGCEPRAGRLRDEPYFPEFAGLVDWASRNTASTLFSCLAAHAAVLHLDGIERRPLPAKHSGIYESAVVSAHPLVAGGPASVPVPHSRWNDLAETELAAAGYAVLRRSEDVGVDLFARETGESLFVFLQGHPEYDGDSLAREYRRDVGRFLAGEREDCPALPAHYFPAATARRLSAFAEAAKRDRSPERFQHFPSIDARPPLQDAWQAGAAALFRNWLALVAERREVRADSPAVTA